MLFTTPLMMLSLVVAAFAVPQPFNHHQSNAPSKSNDASTNGHHQRKFICPVVNDVGATLAGTSHHGSKTSCYYHGLRQRCKYFSGNAAFYSGPSDCPDELVAAPHGHWQNNNGNNNPAPPPAPPAPSPVSDVNSSKFTCPLVDDLGSALLESEIGADNFFGCVYEEAGSCNYFEGNGTFSSGGSTCPSGLVPRA